MDKSGNRLLEMELASALCSAVDSPLSRSARRLIEEGRVEELLNLEIDPSAYSDANNFADDWLIVNLLSKSQSFDCKVDPEQKALVSFYEIEAACTRTNSRLYSMMNNGGLPSWVHEVASRARTILGKLTPTALSRIVGAGYFGPGSAVGYKFGAVTSQKYDGSQTMTHALVPFYRSVVGENWWEHQSKSKHRVVAGNKYFTVPKKWNKRRLCCKEPSLNGFLQSGIGSFMRDRLRLFGVNLRDRTINQRLAGQAYSSHLATIDLSDASDLNARAVPHLLLTEEWNHLLDLARSPFTLMPDGSKHELAKHSSMGNGYTFPLETLIFKSVVDSVVVDVDQRASLTAVYGDDIIVPQWAATEVVNRLEFLGFKVNRTKSHLAGDFFESCGADFFQGVPVRPFYAKADPEEGTDVPYPLRLANALRIYAARRGVLGYCDARFKPVWDLLVEKTPKAWAKLLVPEHFGDVGLVVSEDEAKKLLRRDTRAQHEGFVVRFRTSSVVSKDRRTRGVFLASMNQGSSETFSRGREAIRGLFGRPRVRVATTYWSPGLAWPV